MEKNEKTVEQLAADINSRLDEFKIQLKSSADLDMVTALEKDYKEFREKNDNSLSEFQSKTADMENRLKEAIDRMNKTGDSASPQRK